MSNTSYIRHCVRILQASAGTNKFRSPRWVTLGKGYGWRPSTFLLVPACRQFCTIANCNRLAEDDNHSLNYSMENVISVAEEQTLFGHMQCRFKCVCLSPKLTNAFASAAHTRTSLAKSVDQKSLYVA